MADGRRLADDPVPASLGGQQAAEHQAREVCRRHRRFATLQLSRQRVARALGQLWIDVANASPLLVEQLYWTVDNIPQQEAAPGARGDDQDGAAGCVAWRRHGVDAR